MQTQTQKHNIACMHVNVFLQSLVLWVWLSQCVAIVMLSSALSFTNPLNSGLCARAGFFHLCEVTANMCKYFWENSTSVLLYDAGGKNI